MEQQVNEQSIILSEEEINTTLANEAEVVDEVQLPSEQTEDEYAGLSKEELIAKLKEKQEAPKEETTEEVPTAIVEEFSKRFSENSGSFTEKDYADLEAKGYSKEFVDTYIEGAKAKEKAYYEDLLKPYGTMEEYAEAIVYAQTAWDATQIKAFNDALRKADASTTSVLVSSLMKEFKSSKVKPTENGPITNTRQPSSQGTRGYETKSDMTKDMNDSRYGKDPSYTAKVEEKLLATDMNAWYAGVSKGY